MGFGTFLRAIGAQLMPGGGTYRSTYDDEEKKRRQAQAQAQRAAQTRTVANTPSNRGNYYSGGIYAQAQQRQNPEYNKPKLEERQKPQQKINILNLLGDNELKPPVPAPSTDPRNLFSKAFDQVNIFDNNRTFKQATPTQTKSAFQQAGQFGGQTARGVTTVIPQTANSLAEGTGDTIDLARVALADQTGNIQAKRAALDRGLRSKYSAKGQGLLGTGGLISNEEAQKPMSAGNLTKKIATKGPLGATEVLSLITGGFAAKGIMEEGLKRGFTSQAKTLAGNYLLNTAQGGLQAVDEGKSGKDIIKQAAISGPLGTVTDVAVGGAGVLASKVVPKSKLTKLVNSNNQDEVSKIVGREVSPEVAQVIASTKDENLIKAALEVDNEPAFLRKDPLESLKQEARKYKSAEEFVNSYGEPVYHGSRSSDITEFNLDNLNATYMKDGLGINFTNDRSFAELYRRPKNQWGELASKDDGGGKVYKRYIKATNPLDLTASNRKVSDIVSLEQFKKIAKDGSEIKGEGRKYLERIGRSELTTATNDSRVVAKRVSEMTDDQLLEILYGTIKNKNAVGLDAGLESIFRESMFNYKLTESGKKELVESFRKHTGFDAFKTPKENGNYVITTIDPSNIKTKQQLTDLYNQATGTKAVRTDSQTTAIMKNLTPDEKQSLDTVAKSLGHKDVDALIKATEQPQVASNISKVTPEPVQSTPVTPVDAKGVGTVASFTNKTIDDDYTIIQELRNIEKQTGQTGLVDDFMYNSGRARQANSIATAKFTDSPLVQQAIGGLSKSERDAFNAYSAARRELANANMGMKTSKAVEDLQKTVQEGAQAFEGRYNALRDYYFTLAKDLKDAGIINEEKFNQFTSDPDYVRLQRDFEDIFQPGKGGKSYQLGSTITSLKRTGSTRDVLPAGETALEYTQKIQNEVERNTVGKGLVDVLSQYGQAREISAKDAARRNTIKIFKDGTPHYYEVSKDIAESVQRISPFQLDIIGRIIAAPGRIMRAGTTGLNPVFIAKNLVRDQATQAVFSKDARATSKNMLSGLWGAMKAFGVDNNDPAWKKFIEVSGDTTSYDLTRNIKKTKEVVSEVAGTANKYKDAVLHPIRTLEDFASITEKATRFQGFKGIYEKAIKEGASEQDALKQATLAAWQNTVDFNRAGQWARVANLIFPYTNPAIQGSRQLVRRTREAPVATLVKGTAFVGTPLAIATAWNMGDEERRKAYDNIPEFEKQGSLIVVPPNPKQNKDGSYDVLKIPLPPGISNLYQPFRRGIEKGMGASVNPAKIMGDMLEAFSGPIKISEPGQNVSTFTPQIIKPSIQAATNRDLYTGRPIVPDYVETADVPNSEKAFKNTSGTARIFGKLLNKSPIKVEKFIKDTFGTVGAQATNLSDNILAKAGAIPEEQIGGQSVLEGFKRAFSKSQGIENYNKSEGAKFYDSIKEATKGLNKQQKAVFENVIIGSRKDFTGKTIRDKTYYDSASRAVEWLKDDSLFEASKKVNDLEAKRGKPSDPLFELPPDRRKLVLNMMANYSPGNYEEKAILQLNPWLEEFNKKRSDYFDKVTAEADSQARKDGKPVADRTKDAMGLPIVKATPELQKKLDYSKNNLKTTQDRAQFYADNPDVTDFFKRQEEYQRAKRSFLGLPQFDRYPTPTPEVQKFMDEYNSLPKGNGPAKKDGTASSPDRSNWIKNHPKEWAAMTNQWSKQDVYRLQQEGAKAVYEGIDFTEEGIKSIVDLAKSLGMSTGGGSGGYGYGSKDPSKAWSINLQTNKINLPDLTNFLGNSAKGGFSETPKLKVKAPKTVMPALGNPKKLRISSLTLPSKAPKFK